MPDTENTTDWNLMALLAQSDESALNALIERWEGRILRFVRRQCGCSSADAEEIVSDVFWKIYQARHLVKPTGLFQSWILRIAHNASTDHLRSQMRRPILLSLDAVEENGSNTASLKSAPASQPDAAALDNELATQLERALGELPAKQRAALLLCTMENLSYREIADILQCSVASVESLVFRARQNLRKRLRGYLA